MKILNKRGMDVDFYTIIFIVLNIAYFSIFFLFLYSSQNGSLVYEQAYAKEIALILDSSSRGMSFDLNFSKGFDIASENKRFSDLVTIDEENNLVKVSLKNSGGYQMSYFSDYSFNVTEFPKLKLIRIEVLDDKK